jgi:DNA polymerase kappa
MFLQGRNIGIKLKHTSFELRVRSKTVPSAIWSAHDIERFAKEVKRLGQNRLLIFFRKQLTQFIVLYPKKLLKRELPVKIRLMGIRMSSLEPRRSEEESVAKVWPLDI